MILFRADGNAAIGSGHIMRCLSIADALGQKGEKAVFALADEEAAELVRNRGYECLVLHSDYREMDRETEKLIPYLEGKKFSRLVADSYYVTAEYLGKIREHIPVVYVDDVAAFAYPADLLVNYNVYGPETDYAGLYRAAGVPLPECLLGPRYTPLREMFRNIPPRTQKRKATDVLVSTGGSDPLHLGLKILRETEKNPGGLKWHFLLGAMNRDIREIMDTAEGLDWVEIHRNVTDMRSLILGCDIAVSAAGSTMYETAACGTPMVTYTMADNQIPGAKAFRKLGMAVYCGDLREQPVGVIPEAVHRLAEDYPERCRTGRRMQQLVDGRGAERIADGILGMR